MGYARKPYGVTGYGSRPYNRMSYGLSVDTDGLVFYAPLLTSLEDVYGAVPTFTRASIGTYIGSDGLLKTAAVNEPRFEYDTGGGARGYLSEGERENLCLQSEDFGTTWGVGASSISTDATTAPDGNTTADSLDEDGSAATSHFTRQDITVTADATLALSVYVKKSNRDWVSLWCYDQATSSNGIKAFFDVSTGAVGVGETFGAGTTFTSSSIEDAGNGWYRCILVGKLASGVTGLRLDIYIAEADNDVTFDGLSQSSLYLWGAQLEEASFSSSYIKTQAIAVTRAADSLTYPLALSDDGSLQATVDTQGLGDAATFVRADDGSDVNAIEFTKDAGDLNRFVITGQADIAGTAMVANVSRDLTGTFATNDVTFYQDGVEQGTDALAVIPATTTVRVGNNVAGTSPAFAHIHTVKIYDRLLGEGEI